MPTAIEHAAVVAEGSAKVVPDNADATGGTIEYQSELQQETSVQETAVDSVSSSKDAAHEVETEVEADTHGTDVATTSKNDLAAKELPETEQPVLHTPEVFIFNSCRNALADLVQPLKGDSTKLVIGAAIAAAGLATAEGFSSMDKAVPEGAHEAAPETVNDSVESGTTALNVEPKQEHEVDVTTVPEAEETHPDIDSSLRDDSTPVPLAPEPESSQIETELVAESQVETTSAATTRSVLIDVDPSLSETSPNAQDDIEEVQAQVDDASNIKDEPIPESNVAQRIEAADTAHSEEVPAKESQNVVQLEPEVDFVAPAEEESSVIAQVTAENLSPEIESEDAISQTPVETLPIPEDETASLANVDDQITAPVDARLEHAAVVVETSPTDEPAEIILPPNVEESSETSKPLVEPSYKGSEDEISRVSVFPI